MSKSQHRESHPISEREDAQSTVLGKALGQYRLSTPSTVECARLMDFVESDPQLTRVLAALVQRAVSVDTELQVSLQDTATLEIDAGCVGPGGARQALAVASDLARLLIAPRWKRPSAVLGEDHSPHAELVSLARARLGRREGATARLRRVIRHLEADAERLAAEQQAREEQKRKTKEALRRELEDGGAVEIVELVRFARDELRLAVDHMQGLQAEFSVMEKACLSLGGDRRPEKGRKADDDKTPGLAEAALWLLGRLDSGPCLKTEIEKAAEKEGISHGLLERAAQALPILRRPREQQGPWEWRLPGPGDLVQARYQCPVDHCDQQYEGWIEFGLSRALFSVRLIQYLIRGRLRRSRSGDDKVDRLPLHFRED